MQFLRTLFWVVLAVAAVVFAMRNWSPVTVNLWGGLLVEAKLPVLLYGAFALGLLPAFAWMRATRWRMQRRIDAGDRALAEVHAVHAAPDHPATVRDAVPPAPSTIEPPAQS